MAMTRSGTVTNIPIMAVIAITFATVAYAASSQYLEVHGT